MQSKVGQGKAGKASVLGSPFEPAIALPRWPKARPLLLSVRPCIFTLHACIHRNECNRMKEQSIHAALNSKNRMKAGHFHQDGRTDGPRLSDTQTEPPIVCFELRRLLFMANTCMGFGSEGRQDKQGRKKQMVGSTAFGRPTKVSKARHSAKNHLSPASK